MRMCGRHDEPPFFLGRAATVAMSSGIPVSRRIRVLSVFWLFLGVPLRGSDLGAPFLVPALLVAVVLNVQAAALLYGGAAGGVVCGRSIGRATGRVATGAEVSARVGGIYEMLTEKTLVARLLQQ